jgi:hypothetical protein
VFAFLLNRGIRGSAPLLAVFFILCAVLVYFAPLAIEQYNYPNVFYNFLVRFASGKSLVVLINFLLTGTAAFILVLLAVNEEIVDKQNYFPVFIFLLICLCCLNGYSVAPQLLSNVFGTFSLYRLVQTYRQENALRQIYDAGFWITVSAYFSVASIVYIPVFFIGLLIFRPFYWREWVSALGGLLLPVLIFESIAYLSEFNQAYLFKAVFEFISHFTAPSISEYYIAIGVMLFLLLFIAIASNFMYGFGNTVKKQRAKTMLLWLLFFSAINFFFGAINSSGILLSYAVPISIFVGDFLFGIRQVKITNTILVFLLLGAFVIVAAEYGGI